MISTDGTNRGECVAAQHLCTGNSDNHQSLSANGSFQFSGSHLPNAQVWEKAQGQVVRFGHVNVNSLCNKIDCVDLFDREWAIDLLAINET